MAASFNRSSWTAKGDVVSTDLRAFNNIGDAMLGARKNLRTGLGEATDEYGLLGLTGYGPNINVVKDPRYGRNSELPGEDPVLTGEYAVNYVKGMQQTKTGKGGKPVLKMLSSLKHYTAYSVETSRFTFSASVTNFTLHDSNLPQYEAAFVEGGASGAMCCKIVLVMLFSVCCAAPTITLMVSLLCTQRISPPTASRRAATSTCSTTASARRGSGRTPSSCPTAARWAT